MIGDTRRHLPGLVRDGINTVTNGAQQVCAAAQERLAPGPSTAPNRAEIPLCKPSASDNPPSQKGRFPCTKLSSNLQLVLITTTLYHAEPSPFI